MATTKQERAEQILGELAELSLMLARDLAVQAKATEDVAEKTALVEAFQKTSRCARLTLALDFKLQRDAERDARDAVSEARAEAAEAQRREARAAEAARPTEVTSAEIQKRRVRNILNRLIWTESEGDEEDYEVLCDDLDARLYEASRAPGFADIPVEVLAAKLAADMRLSGELVITTADHFTVAGAPQPPLADTG